MPKIKGGGVICSEFEKNTRGDPYYFLEKYIKGEKITRGYPYCYFENSVKCFKNVRGYPYNSFEDSFIF